MKVAVTYENGQVFQHFGHSKQFKVYEIQGQQAGPGEILDAGGSGHSALAQLLQQAGVDALICGGIGGGAREALRQAGIRLYAGVTGPADDAAQALAQGTAAKRGRRHLRPPRRRAPPLRPSRGPPLRRPLRQIGSN